MARPLVSVRMITFNHAPYISQAIESILKQKVSFPFELVIGEDCSTDGTREIVFSYANMYPDKIRIITSESNVGMKKNSARTNYSCDGKYIALCDGDDYWIRDDKLEKQISFLENNIDYGLVHSDFNLKNEFTGQTILRYYQSNIIINDGSVDDIFLDILLNKYMIRTSTACLRTNLIKSIIEMDKEVFQSNRFLLGDKPMWLEISRLSKIKYFDEVMSLYRKHEGGVSGLMDNRKYAYFELSVLDMLMYYIEKYNYTNKVPYDFLDRKVNNILGYAFDTSDKFLATRVKEIRGRLTIKLWLLHQGSKNKFLNALLKPFVNLKRGYNFLG